MIDEAVTMSRIGAMTYLAPTMSLVADEAILALDAAIANCIGLHRITVVIDLSKVALVCGRALELMVSAAARLAGLGGWLRVAYPSALLQDIFAATGVSDQVAQYDAPPVVPRPTRGNAQRKLGDILVERELATAAQVSEAARLQEQTGRRMGFILIEKKWLSEVGLFQALAEQLGLPFVTLRAGLYDPAAVALIERDVARRLNVIPLFVVHNVLTIATGEPQAIHSFDDIKARTGLRIRVV
ncbi:MAG: hypothetical protein M3N23_00805, partial [Pseudomonadota bacterium]|nr:hypothetical protein [Pseudomonadota bacterium]